MKKTLLIMITLLLLFSVGIAETKYEPADFIGEYELDWYDVEVSLKIFRENIIKQEIKEDTISVYTVPSIRAEVRYQDYVFDAWFTSYEDDLLLHIEIDEDDFGFYTIEKLYNSDDIYAYLGCVIYSVG